MGSAKTFLLKAATASGANFGSLQDGGSLTSATTTTGWGNGILSGGYYGPMTYGATSSSGWSITPAPDTILNNTSGNADAWRTESKYTGTFLAGTWTFATSLIASSAATGSGKLRFRLWRGSDPTGYLAVQLTTSVVETNNWSNLTTSTAQNLSGTQSLTSITLNNEYLFWQMAMLTVTANDAVSATQMIRVDATNSKLVTPSFAPALPASNVKSVVTQSGRNGAIVKPGKSLGPVVPQTYYQMRGWYAAGGVYETWVATGAPSMTPPSGHTLTGIVVVATWTA